MLCPDCGDEYSLEILGNHLVEGHGYEWSEAIKKTRFMKTHSERKLK